MDWDLAGIVDAAAEALRAEAARLDDEQSPFGIDALDELRVHPLLRNAFAAAGYTALSEQRFPGHRGRARRSEGDRCDLVLLDPGHESLEDPLADPALFQPPGAAPESACWIEVKLVSQFKVIDGEARPNRGYTSQLLQAATADIRKLMNDERIRAGGLLLVMFTQSDEAAEHDLDVWVNRCITKGLSIPTPVRRGFAVTDRIGNCWCETALASGRGHEKTPAATSREGVGRDGSRARREPTHCSGWAGDMRTARHA
ncbi:MAG: hypothetical protein VYC34_12240, partial [Planctomycetota bacterium]|nr:hypothetical protein [Planctomycetota bacterium]